ncbi:N-acetylneuraminate lyase [Anabrus simplex]|uniref:N-acetylneuraminate lyase n=1 Tax=Anabrus simplex TaxID=316456 RepID=UPI0035A2835D
MKFPFHGLMAPVLTPFTDDSEQNLKLEEITKYAKFLNSIGITAVLVNGTSGEGMSMTVAERKAVTEAWVTAVKETRQTLMVQIGGASIRDVQDMAKHCESLKVDGLLCLPDLFNKPGTIEDLVNYLHLVSKSAPKTPLLYYHLPGYTGVNLDMAKFLNAAAAEIPTFCGAKFTHTDLQEGARCLEAAGGNLSLFLGCDQIMAGAYILGFDSAIATTLNMLPGPSQKILAAVKNNNNSEALQEQRKLTKAIDVMTRNGGWVATMKAAMNVMTPINVGAPRPPLKALTKEHIQQLKEELRTLKLIS